MRTITGGYEVSLFFSVIFRCFGWIARNINGDYLCNAHCEERVREITSLIAELALAVVSGENYERTKLVMLTSRNNGKK